MSTTEAFKNTLLGASDIDTLALYNGDPGAAGTTNEITGGGYSRQSATFAAASGGERVLSAAVDFTGTASQPVDHLGFWAGATFRGSEPLAGDAAFNSAGEYQITTGTKITLTDAA